MNRNVLIVDDDHAVLRGFRRLLADDYTLTVHHDPMEALKELKINKSFAVVVSDYRMPGIDGTRFLSFAKELAPDTVRVMLTGHADLDMAVNAVNRGHIFRFLTKPCENDMFISVLNDSIHQFRLVSVEKEMARRERELLEKTLQGSIKVLVQILSLTKPKLFAQAQQIRKLAKGIAVRLNVEELWEVELASMLFHIGLVTLPHDVVDQFYETLSVSEKAKDMFEKHPVIAEKLISHIPRLEKIARGIGMQLFPQDSLRKAEDKRAVLISKIVKVASDFKILERKHDSEARALEKMRSTVESYDSVIVDALEAEILSLDKSFLVREIEIRGLSHGMVLAADIVDARGRLIVASGTEVSEMIRMKLQNFEKVGRSLTKPKILVKAN